MVPMRRGGPGVWEAVGAMVVVALGILHASASSVVVNNVPADIFVALDAGWRWQHGQWPHLHYMTPVGWLYAAAYGIAMDVVGPDPRVLLWVPAALAPLLYVHAVWVLSGRWTGPLPAAMAVGFATQVLSPLHADSGGFAHLGTYNRVGWALVAGLLLQVGLAKTRPAGRGADAVEAMAIAVVTAGLFFLKVTYFGLVGGALGLAVLFAPERRRVAFAGGLGALAFVGLAFAVSDVPSAYLADLRSAAASWDPELMPLNDRTPGIDKLKAVFDENVVAILLALAAATLAARSAPPGVSVDGEVLAAMGQLVGIVAIGVQSHDHHVPALIVPLFLCLVAAMRVAPTSNPVMWMGWLSVALALGRSAGDAIGVVSHRVAPSSLEGLVPAADSGPGARLLFGGSPTPEGGSRVDLILDGRVSLRAVERLGTGFDSLDFVSMVRSSNEALGDLGIPADARILGLWFSNPHPYLRGAAPPRGTHSWYHIGRTFGGERPLDPAVVLADVDVVIRPTSLLEKWQEADTMATMLAPGLTGWTERHPNNLWTVWIRPGLRTEPVRGGPHDEMSP